MSYFLPFCVFFFSVKFSFQDGIFHPAVIYRPKFSKRDRVIKTRLATDSDGYVLNFLFIVAYSDGLWLDLSC